MLSQPLEPIDQAEALRYMGCPEEPSPSLAAVMETCDKQLRQAARPGAVYRVLPLTRHPDGLFAETLPLPGKDAAAHLEGCEQVLLLAATLSGGVDQLIRRAEISDMTQALAMDALASAAIEQVCNRAEEQFREQLPEWYFTWRFSPGYGDLPLTLQPRILQLLNAEKRLGLTVTPEHILIPRKSVTALIGLSRQPLKKSARGCVTCRMRESCPFRRMGKRC